MRALDATPASAAALGLAAFEPSFTQEPRFTDGPKTFYGMLLVVSLVMVLVLAVGLTVKQACARRLWLATATADAQAQSSFAEPGAGGSGAAEAEDRRGLELAEVRMRRTPDGGSGAGLPESGLMETPRGSGTRSGGGLAAEPEPEAGGAAAELPLAGVEQALAPRPRKAGRVNGPIHVINIRDGGAR